MGFVSFFGLATMMYSLTVRGTQALVSFAPLAFKLFCAARQNAVLRRSPFPSLVSTKEGDDVPEAIRKLEANDNAV